MSNLIVILSIIFFFFCGIECNEYSVQFGEELLRKGDFTTFSQLARDCCNPQKATCGTHVGNSNNASVRGNLQLARN